MAPRVPSETGLQVRQASRHKLLDSSTSGLAPSHLQANLIILPSRYAEDFRLLCQRNPVPCPLLAESRHTGAYDSLRSYVDGFDGDDLASDLDIRSDAPRYMVYENGKLTGNGPTEISEQWTTDHVAFLIGCSYSFETALALAGLSPRHTIMDRVVPMYRTNIPLCPAGVFDKGTYVVSMRPYKRSDIDQVRDITRRYVATHGEPIAWGWDAVDKLGIVDVNMPDWGDAPLTLEGQPLAVDDNDEIPIFWGCGVTPQNAVMSATLDGLVMGHAPGHMLLLDIKDSQVFGGAETAA